MVLTRVRNSSGWIGALMAPMLFFATTIQAKTIPSQLSGTRSLIEARKALSVALAAERLTAFGFTQEESLNLVEASLAAGAHKLLRDAGRISQAEKSKRLSFGRDKVLGYHKRFLKGLSQRNLNPDRLAEHLPEHGRLPRKWSNGMGLTLQQAVLVESEWDKIGRVWVADDDDEDEDRSRRVVGINYKGIGLMLLPLLAIGWVAAVAGASVGGVLLIAVGIGLVFVLFADPAFIFGSRDREV